MKKSRIIGIILLCSIALGWFIGAYRNALHLEEMTDYCVSTSGDFYVLQGAGTAPKITHFSADGTQQGSKMLETGTRGQSILYRAITADKKNNLYLQTQISEWQSVGSDEPKHVVLKEQIQVYDSNMEWKRNAIVLEHATGSETNHLKNAYVYDTTLYAIYGEGTKYHVVQADIAAGGAPYVKKTVTLLVSEENIRTFIAAPDGSMLYATQNGRLYRLGKEGSPVECSSMIGGQGVVQTLFLNGTGQICLTEVLSGTMFCLQDSYADRVYARGSLVQDMYTFGQLERVKCSPNGELTAWLKGTNTLVPLEQGTQVLLHKPWFPGFVLQWLLSSVCNFTILCVLYFVIHRLTQRIGVIWRILLMFIPVYLIAAILLTFALAKLSMVPVKQTLGQSMTNVAAQMLQTLEKAEIARISLLTGQGTEEYQALLTDFQNKSDTLMQITGRIDAYTIYYRADHQFFAACTTEGTAAFIPMEDAELAAVFEETVMDTDNVYGTYRTLFGHGGQYACTITRIALENGIGILEVHTDAAMALQAVFHRNLLSIGLYVGMFSLIVLLAFIQIVWHNLKPLLALQQAALAIAGGKWMTKVEIPSKSELSDIADTFHGMTEQLYQSDHNMEILHHVYQKFLPQELFQLLGKEDIAKIRPQDKQVFHGSVLYASFYFEKEMNLSKIAYFEFIEEYFDKLIVIVRKNNGVIAQFDGERLLALFPKSEWDAVCASIQLKGLFYKQPECMHMIVTTGEVILGIAGNESRNVVIAASEEIKLSNRLDSFMNKAGLHHVFTEEVWKKLSEDKRPCCRVIGAAKHPNGMITQIYEVLEGLSYYEKKLYTLTNAQFERGVACYRCADFAQARDCFAAVVSVNQFDGMAMYYLALCEENSQSICQKWEGVLL